MKPKGPPISQSSSNPSIARSTALMSTATTLSRVTGFVRMWATGYALGVTALASAYNVANNIPNMIFEFVAGGILSSLFIPTFLELRNERGEEDAYRFASHVLNLAIVALGFVAVLGTVWPEPFIWTQTFRMSAEAAAHVRSQAEFLFRFFAIQVVAYGAGMVVQGLLNAQRRYLWTALGPVFNNFVVIATMLAYPTIYRSNPQTALIVLAAGTTLGVLTMFAVMVPDLMKSGVRYHFEFGLSDPAVRKMLKLALPTVIYVVTNLVAVSFRNASALAVSGEGPSTLMYAWTFFQLPYGILAVALATAVFTELSDAAGRKDMVALKEQFRRGLRSTAVLMIPASALLIALAQPLISLYRAGAFRAEDVAPVATALRTWSAGLVFFACMMFTLRTFYSMKDTRTPMLANLALTPVQIGLYLLLPTGIAGWKGLGITGIPLADITFYLLLFVTLALLLRRRIGGYDLRGFASTAARMLVASVAGGGVAWWLAGVLAPAAPGFGPALMQVTAGGIAGLLVAFGGAKLLRVEELDIVTNLIARLGSRFSRGRTKG
ncbi:MAG TPA: murein biosynthesis integral membrane protein MurJ [Coriobacteriia bacterium]|nr:murein biosynthesis integral membrane protein MurJ [Coriobacteriia bacterium]